MGYGLTVGSRPFYQTADNRGGYQYQQSADGEKVREEMIKRYNERLKREQEGVNPDYLEYLKRMNGQTTPPPPTPVPAPRGQRHPATHSR